jgi:GntR family transcriptional regulator, transcriptional repressor for pyruvate dehydrogenase complex
LEALEFRKVVETGMIDLVVKKITKEDLANLKKCIVSHKKGLTQDTFPAEGDMLFHETLAQATHNKVFIELFEDIYILIMESVFLVKDYRVVYKNALEFHERIYNSLLNNDKDSAKEAMQEHIDWLIKIASESKE